MRSSTHVEHHLRDPRATVKRDPRTIVKRDPRAAHPHPRLCDGSTPPRQICPTSTRDPRDFSAASRARILTRGSLLMRLHAQIRAIPDARSASSTPHPRRTIRGFTRPASHVRDLHPSSPSSRVSASWRHRSAAKSFDLQQLFPLFGNTGISPGISDLQPQISLFGSSTTRDPAAFDDDAICSVLFLDSSTSSILHPPGCSIANLWLHCCIHLGSIMSRSQILRAASERSTLHELPPASRSASHPVICIGTSSTSVAAPRGSHRACSQRDPRVLPPRKPLASIQHEPQCAALLTVGPPEHHWPPRAGLSSALQHHKVVGVAFLTEHPLTRLPTLLMLAQLQQIANHFGLMMTHAPSSGSAMSSTNGTSFRPANWDRA